MEIDTILDKGTKEKIYALLTNDKQTEIVLLILKSMKKISFEVDEKNELEANLLISLALETSIVWNQLGLCNRALMKCHSERDTLKSVLLFRFNVFQQLKCIQAALKDINKALSIRHFREKDYLLKHKIVECKSMEFLEDMKTDISAFANKFFKFDVERNKDVPYFIKDVNIAKKNGDITVTAGNFIKVGTVVAIEEAFVCHVEEARLYSCYKCHKLGFDVTPCPGCCFVNYCNEKCRDACYSEYHKYECKIISFVEKELDTKTRLMVKAALKIKSKLSWPEFIKFAKNIRGEVTNASLKEICGDKNYLSIFTGKDNNFANGAIFTGGLAVAKTLKVLMTFTDLFPNRIKNEAVNAMATIMIHLYVHRPNIVEIKNAARNEASCTYDIITDDSLVNYGWFPLTGQLKHHCKANLVVVGLNDKIALVAVRPIKAGEELTIAYGDHEYEGRHIKDTEAKLKLYDQTRILCECKEEDDDVIWTDEQEAALRNWRSMQSRMKSSIPEKRCYEIICNTLQVLDNLDCLAHIMVAKSFFNYIHMYQYAATKNWVVKAESAENRETFYDSSDSYSD